MRDICRITRPGEGQVWNPATLQYEQAPDVVVYEGKCKLRRADLQARAGQAAGQVFIEQGSKLHLPMLGSGDVGKDHEGVMLSSRTDPALVGARFTVENSEAYSNGVSRRFTVKGVQ